MKAAHGENNMASEYEFKVTAGVMIRKTVRALLEREKFYGRSIRWMEEKGWVDSVFIIRGEYDDAKAVESCFDAYAKALDAA